MRDAAEALAVTTARLRRAMDEGECKRRNALSQTRDGFNLKTGDVVTVVETFGANEAFLVEFNKPAKKAKAKTNDVCEWMGVLYPTEIEMLGGAPDKA